MLLMKSHLLRSVLMEFKIYRYFHELKGNDEIPSGLDWSACLLVSKESLLSLLTSSSTTHTQLESVASESSIRKWPFVLAVDVDFDEGDKDEDEEYNGYFKVAIETLLNDFFPVLARNILAPNEIMATLNSEDDVWIGM